MSRDELYLRHILDAIQKIERATRPLVTTRERGWRSVFGGARPEEVEEIDRIVAEEFERVDPDAWR